MGKFLQGTFEPKHPEKYVGDSTKIRYRSSWEKFAMLKFDENPSIIKWNSEEKVIPYYSPVDGKMHRYFPDFIIQVKDVNGKIWQYMIEIKPHCQTILPKQTKNKKPKRLQEEVETFVINSAKWSAAREFCKRNSMEFKIMTEHDLNMPGK